MSIIFGSSYFMRKFAISKSIFTNLFIIIVMKKLSFILLSACMLLLVSCTNSTPSSVAKDYLTAIQKGDYEKAVDLIHFQKEMTASDKEEVAKLMREKIEINGEPSIEDIEITGEDVKEDGEHAKVSYKYKDKKKDKEKTDKLDLVKIDGKWMIDSGK